MSGGSGVYTLYIYEVLGAVWTSELEVIRFISESDWDIGEIRTSVYKGETASPKR